MILHRISAICLAAIMASGLAASQTEAAPYLEVGVLNCTVEGGVGFIFGSTKNLTCKFDRPTGPETYFGTIAKFGIDIGFTQKGVIIWTVLAPTNGVPPGALAGNYAGVSAEATVGIGAGANALLGGSNDSFVLQPLSVQAQQGLNVAVGISSLTLRQ